MRLAASSSTTSCVSCLPAGVIATTRRSCGAAVNGVECGGDDVDPQNHPGPAAVGLVVHLPGTERRGVTVVEEPEIELLAEYGREGSLLRQPRVGVREKREDVDLHRGVRLLGLGEAARDKDSPPLEIDLPHTLSYEREQQARFELEHVVRGVVRDLTNPAERPAALLDDLETDQVRDVEGVLIGLGQR